MDDLTSTAYHEAGHAVLALSLKRPFTKISIEPVGDRLGSVTLEHHENIETDPISRTKTGFSILLEDAIISCAGGLVKERLTGEIDWHKGSWGDSVNVGKSVLYISLATDETWEQCRHRIMDLARHQVNKYWQEIEVLAAALLSKTVLDYHEVLEIIDISIFAKEVNPEWYDSVV